LTQQASTFNPTDVIYEKDALKRALFIDCGNDTKKKLEWLQPIVDRVKKGNLMGMGLAEQIALREVVAELNGESPRPESEKVSVQATSEKISPFSFPSSPSHRANANKEAKR